MKMITALIAATVLSAAGTATADTQSSHRGASTVYVKDADRARDRHNSRYDQRYDKRYDKRYGDHRRDKRVRQDVARHHRQSRSVVKVAFTYPVYQTRYRSYSTHRPYRASPYQAGYSDGYREGFRDGQRVSRRHLPRPKSW